MAKTITVDPVTRIEGHARITLDCDDDGTVLNGHLHVLELRGFEKLVEGMELFTMPLITARICGVCPAAHHIASVMAIENGLGITIPPQAKILREMLYMGHILHSHALSCFLLVGPDLFFDTGSASERSIFHLLSDSPDLAKKALRLRSIGQKIVEKIGGRGIHPVTAIPGGLSSRPSPDDIKTIKGWSDEALSLLEELYPVFMKKLSGLNTLKSATELVNMKAVALSNNQTVDFLSGDALIVNSDGTSAGSFTAADHDRAIVENIMPGSYMKSVRLTNGESYFVGPLSRQIVNGGYSTPLAQKYLDTFRTDLTSRWTAFDAIEARCIEMVHCAERTGDLCNEFRCDDPVAVQVPSGKAAICRSMIEAPRGILIHDYTSDENGHVVNANLIVATQNNYDAIDATITSLARQCRTSGEDERLLNAMEFAVRCFDPCLSCATHVAGRMALSIVIRNSSDRETVRIISKGESQ